ncbi:MAG: hypothetical protein VW625_01270 [Perlucidibaca sp.]
MRCLLIAASLGLLLGGCQSLPARSPAAELALRDHNQADAALAQGDLARAEAGFRSAMQQASALDDWQGEADSRLGLAVTLQRMNRQDEARQLLQPLLADTSLPYTPDQRQRAALRRAQWQLAGGDWNALAQDLELASGWCGNCRDSDLHRLRAQLALHQNQLTLARQQAELALTTADSPDRQTEALRLRANLSIASADTLPLSQGLAAIQAALDTDKRLGNSVGIFQDLLLHAWLAHLAGHEDAPAWLRRACRVARASGQPWLQQLQQLPKEIWHVPAQASRPSGPDTAVAPAGAGDCRQP